MTYTTFRLPAVVFVFVVCLMQTQAIAADEPTVAQQAAAQRAPTSEQLDFVRQKVIPLLEARCYECHQSAEDPKGGLLLSSRKAMLKGGDSGAAIVPGRPEESLLIEAVRYEGFEMPPRSRMPSEEVAIFEQWIADGAHWPAELDADGPATSEFPLQARRSAHWAWQNVENPDPPEVQDPSWPRTSADRFVQAQLEASELKPADDADRYTLIRRLYFDLTGLPPRVEQVQAFVNDPRSDDEVIAEVADRLLASPRFGERWGRHWLDLVRYAETLGHEFDYPLPNAWRYRDYVIRAFNEDVPYDQFVTEHIAGDLLPAPRQHPTEGFNESLIATGFWFLCEDKHAPVDVKGEEAAKVDNQIDVFSRAFLGMTVACARCHDHKFDAISTADYYALSGFLQSSRRQTAWLDTNRGVENRLKQIDPHRTAALTALRSHIRSDQVRTDIRRYIDQARELQRTGKTFPLSTEDAERLDDYDLAVLQNWYEKLTSDDSAPLSNHLSALRLATSSQQDFGKRVTGWQRSVKAPRPQESESTLLARFDNGVPEGWFTTGPAFSLPVTTDDIELRDGSPNTNSGQGLSSASRSRETKGMLSSPTFELNHPEILVRVRGEGSKVRLVIDGYIMYEYNALLFHGFKSAIDTKGQWQWIRLGGDVHRYQGHRAHLEFLDEGAGWFAVDEVRFAHRRGSPPPGDRPTDINLRLADTDFGSDITPEGVIDAWMLGLEEAPDAFLPQLMEYGLVPELNANTAWVAARKTWQELAAGLPPQTPIIALTEGTPEDEFVFIRGNHKNRGPVAPRNILTALQNPDAAAFQGSGRLQLTEQLFAESNPLPARVAVNRIWHHLFGRGIVESTDNFGALGKTPTHPLLLDHLATQFRKDGWSVKRMIRSLVLSRTYRMSGQRTAQADAKDPTNRLFHRAAVRRLTGEAVRDAVLKVSGRLDSTMYGAPVPVKLTRFMQGRGRPRTDGPLDGNGRRSIYIAVNRNFLSPFMLAFDVPAPVSTTGRRTVSNVPAQALIMLNNEFINQQARRWAEQLLQHTSPQKPQDVASRAWFELLGRPANDEELALLTQYLGDQPVTTEALTEVCHVLLNSKEFLFLR
ncbi:MAG: PSD1 and planctomycete cytochrome C domain-containing protein [Planctomycetaceae bacterium]|nr:PSD1 and planctomycete cytochrome C domain-containing protein [Planctomycetaceae bacterium]